MKWSRMMAKKRASSSASRSKALVGQGAGHGTTPNGSRVLGSIEQGLKLRQRLILSLNLRMGSTPSCCSRVGTGTGCSECSIDSARYCTYHCLAYRCIDNIVECVRGIGD
ncbi:hypothetical protein HAX54_003802 [Datura stramonium]|uniref:Uncharacterized protein n=1 Tax=Datura stramonium TaxID=4076 RepID=A0ABS8T5X1_DATST|nr:hypothetical protein [Datura stramonium]